MEFQAPFVGLEGIGDALRAQQDDAVVVDRLVEVGRQTDRDIEPAFGGLQVIRHQRFGPEVVVVVAGCRQVADRLETPVGLRLVGQEVVGGHVAVDVHAGDDVTAADDDAVVVVPALVVLDLDEEGIQTPLPPGRHEEVDEGEAVAAGSAECLGGGAGGA